ncbi:MAG: hypothetical protein EOO13_14440 [Chitinophagaceae bacterium]|nr:MAG: hypothetical protein EOO13_14440 [Chitinophagaceae bacterium]
MNWGTKIVIVFSLFVSGILLMVFLSARQNMDLVVPDYYEQELKFQDVIDATEHAQGLSKKLVCSVENDTLQILFPPEMKQTQLKGMLWLYCIADKQKDAKQDFVIDSGLLKMPLGPLNKGLHEVKISWTAAAVNYYQEQKIFIQ